MMKQVSYIYEKYRIDFGQVMAFAYEYVDAKKEWERKRSRNGYISTNSSTYRNYAFCEAQLWGIANVIGIPMYVLVQAVRSERKYYKMGGSSAWRGLEYERLIVGLDANRREYDDE